MIKHIIGWVLILLPIVSFADAGVGVPKPLLTPMHYDVSVNYLASMFGVVDGVLHGTGSQILGRMFKMFNTILFGFAGLLWTYTSFIGILNTASQGQFLGQRWSSMWVPFRIVSGAIFLLPKATTGYSMIQVIVMYIVLQGVGAANQVWSTALGYLQGSKAHHQAWSVTFGDAQQGNTIVELAQPLRPNRNLHAPKAAMEVADNQLLIDHAGKVLKAQVAMFTLYNDMERQGRSLGLQPLPHFAQTLHAELEEGKHIMRFPGPLGGGKRIKGSCGFVKWTDKHHERMTSAGVQLMASQLLPVAQHIANKIVPLQPVVMPVVPTTQSTPKDNSGTAAHAPQVTFQKGGGDLHDAFLPYNGALINAASDCFALLKPELRQERYQADRALQDQFTTMAREGWILAGSYYYQLSEFNQKNNRLNEGLSVPTDKIETTVIDKNTLKSKIRDSASQAVLDAYWDRIDQYIQSEKNRVVDYHNPKLSPQSHEGGIDFGHEANADSQNLFSPVEKNMQQFQHHMEATMQSQIDPIMALAKIGNVLIKSVENTWKEIAENIKSIKDIVEQGNMNVFFMPLMLIWITLNFTVGATLIYYIPLMPFLLFFFGSLTWFAFVIEAMVAAPLIALGMTHPEGHDFFGKAEQAVMLLASIFLRPMLMIFGFILGMIFCTVAFNLFHYGYSIAVQAVGKIEGEGWLHIVTHTAMMVVYTTTAMSIVNRSFAMIYEIPNRALRWMGGPTEGHNDAEGAMQVKGGVERYAGEAGSLTRNQPPPSESSSQVHYHHR